MSDEHGFPRLLSRKWGEGASRNSCSVVFNTDRFGESRGSKNTSRPQSLTKMLLPTKHHSSNFNTNIFTVKIFSWRSLIKSEKLGDKILNQLIFWMFFLSNFSPNTTFSCPDHMCFGKILYFVILNIEKISRWKSCFEHFWQVKTRLKFIFRCNNLSSCRFPVDSTVFNDPCSLTRKYLQVEFECVKHRKFF